MDLKEFIKLSRKIGVPRTGDTEDFTKSHRNYMNVLSPGTSRIMWNKRGGYAGGKSIKRVIDKAKAMGFRENHMTVSEGHLDNVRFNREFRLAIAGDWSKIVLRTSEFYGATKSDNRYSIDLSIECVNHQ